jgi:putative ABC transport system substrate-binding protein
VEGAARTVSRRALLKSAAGVALASACGSANPSAPVRPRTIGYLSTGNFNPPDAPANVAFRDAMRAEGFVEGADYDMTYRFANGDPDQVLPLAKDILDARADVIVCTSTGATQAARRVTAHVPIVMIASHDPIDAGVVKDLAKPGENVTGQSLAGATLMPKQLDYLVQIAPVRKLGYLSPTFPSYGTSYPSVTDAFERSMRAAAKPLGIEVIPPNVPKTGDVGQALATLAAESVNALFTIESPTWFTGAVTQRPINQIVDFATRRRLPLMGAQRMYADQGFLLTYGDVRSGVVMHNTVARYVARILRGERPGDLAVDVPKSWELVVNAKTALAIGLDVPQPLIAQAALVIR